MVGCIQLMLRRRTLLRVIFFFERCVMGSSSLIHVLGAVIPVRQRKLAACAVAAEGGSAAPFKATTIFPTYTYHHRRHTPNTYLVETSNRFSRPPPLPSLSCCQLDFFSSNWVRVHETSAGRTTEQKDPQPCTLVVVHAAAFLLLACNSAIMEGGMQQLLASRPLSAMPSAVASQLVLGWLPC